MANLIKIGDIHRIYLFNYSSVISMWPDSLLCVYVKIPDLSSQLSCPQHWQELFLSQFLVCRSGPLQAFCPCFRILLWAFWKRNPAGPDAGAFIFSMCANGTLAAEPWGAYHGHWSVMLENGPFLKSYVHIWWHKIIAITPSFILLLLESSSLPQGLFKCPYVPGIIAYKVSSSFSK